jgi:hypothetical protein
MDKAEYAHRKGLEIEFIERMSKLQIIKSLGPKASLHLLQSAVDDVKEVIG